MAVAETRAAGNVLRMPTPQPNPVRAAFITLDRLQRLAEGIDLEAVNAADRTFRRSGLIGCFIAHPRRWADAMRAWQAARDLMNAARQLTAAADRLAAARAEGEPR
ncbi:MAG: hypothetical protein AB7F67_03995 [Rhodospirillaceae bacterium]